ncbi:MAG: phenylacetate-CoA oxygenase subunit PaaC [Saprospiraceae bacterium]|nr:phenylacetate-CoA oxygenase subunit PaaC [Saprospiraceae bacterium]
MTKQEALFIYTLQLADNCLILGQRLSELCGHGPELETDIGISNIALDLIGQCRSLYQYAAEIEGKGQTEDQLAMLREGSAYRNVLLVEYPNEDFAYTMVRQFFFDVHHYLVLDQLKKSTDERLAAIAAKSIKEVTYHLRYSSEWMIRLGDGTTESHERMQNAVDELWLYTDELCTMNEADQLMIEAGVAPNQAEIKPLYYAKIEEILEKATLAKPSHSWQQYGGKEGRHTEYLSHLLTDLQYMQRTYPNMEW